MAQNTGAGQTFTTDNLVGRRTFIGTTTPAYPVAGDVWIDNSAGSAPNANFTTYTATGGETSVTVTYTVNYELVYLNGVKLVRGTDYIATTGTSITGLTALVANDIVEVVSFTSFLVNGAVNLSTVTAKGDILAATGNSTITNVAVGSDGSTLVADSSTSTGLRYNPTSAAGKNAIINGGMDIWQRGTSIAIPASTTAYTCDRFLVNPGANAATTVSRQLTSDTTNLPNIQYCARIQRNSGQTGTTTQYFGGALESTNSISFAGKQVTLSFYARSGANFSATSNILSYHILTGTGTDQALFSFTGQVDNALNATLTATWQKFTQTITVPTTATQLGTAFGFTPSATYSPAGANDYFEITGVQLELGSTATTFSRAGGSIGGELAACQRYYWRWTAGATYARFPSIGIAVTSSQIHVGNNLPVTMRTTPSGGIDYGGNFRLYDLVNSPFSVSSMSLIGSTELSPEGWFSVTSSSSSLVQYRMYSLNANNDSTAYVGFSAEL